MKGLLQFKDLLKHLNINSGDVLFFHSSFKRIAYLELSPEHILNIIMEIIGPEGTLVLPAYGWSGTSNGYKEYYESRTIFNIKEKCNIGYIPETFRKMDGVQRSISYWWSVCAWGKLSEIVTSNQQNVTHYYGADSSFGILHEHKVKILGLGVSLNTTSLSPIVDYRLGENHTQNVFSTNLETGLIKGFDGHCIETNNYWLLPDYVKTTKPSRVFEYSQKLRKTLIRKDEFDTIQFSYDFNMFFQEAFHLGMEMSHKKQPMPWLANYPLAVEYI